MLWVIFLLILIRCNMEETMLIFFPPINFHEDRETRRHNKHNALNDEQVENTVRTIGNWKLFAKL